MPALDSSLDVAPSKRVVPEMILKEENRNLDKVFDPRPSSGVDDMGPMAIGVNGQFLVAFDKQDARVANLSGASGAAEATLEVILVLVAHREPRTA